MQGAISLDSSTEALQQFVQAQGGIVDLNNCTIRITLRSRSELDRLVTNDKRKVRYFEAFVFIEWRASKDELRYVCERLVEAGLRLLHVQGIALSTASQLPAFFQCDYDSLIILYNNKQPSRTYIFITQNSTRIEYLGLWFSRPVDISGVFWDNLANYLFDEVGKIKKKIGASAFSKLGEKLGWQPALDLAGISVFHPESNIWEGQLGVKQGNFSGLEEAPIPNVRFSTADLERGFLRRLVLQSHIAEDMLQVLSLMDCSPMLQKIEVLDQENTIFTRVESICQKCHGCKLPLEVTFWHQQETVLAKLVFRGKDGPISEPSEASSHSQNYPAIDVLEWNYDLVSGPIGDYDVRLLGSVSRVFPSVLICFNIDITALTLQGLVSVQSVFQRSSLECIHLKCVPFMPYLRVSIGSVLQPLRWSTVKSLVLTGSNIDDWLKLLGQRRRPL